eukprot:PRCOL_00006130-RA
MASLRRAAPAALGRLWALPFALRCHPSAATAADVAGARAYAAAADGALGPTANSSNAAGDLRGTSGVGLGDGISAHTDKWMTPGTGKKSPMELIAEVAPIGVEEDVAVCYGHEDPVLGHPVEFIKVSTATKENPAVCKYCGLRYYQLHH